MKRNSSSPRSTELVWHYTAGVLARLIFESGELRPTSSFIEPGEKPILWFSKNQRWEQTANKGGLDASGIRRTLSMVETMRRGEGLFRFGITADMVTDWPRIGILAYMKPSIRAGLIRGASAFGANHREWCGVLEPIPLSQIVAFQKMNEALDWEELAERPVCAPTGTPCSITPARKAATW